MIKNINVKSKNALEELTQFKEKKYVMCDVRLENVDLRNVNPLIGTNLFAKNDLFINSDSLWSLMNEDEDKSDNETHTHHPLTPTDILDALNNMQNPYCVFKTKFDRISIIVSCLSHYREPLMAIIEIGADLINKKNANINKLVTMYPYSKYENLVNKLQPKELLYLNRLILQK